MTLAGVAVIVFVGLVFVINLVKALRDLE